MTDNDALYRVGRKLLDNGNMTGGFARLRDAAHAGHAAASHHVAMLLASEADGIESWEYVLAYTGRAAKAGHGLAQRTLAFMAGDAQAEAAILRGDALGDDTWHRLHDAINLADWLRPPRKVVVRESPHIVVLEDFITPAMCDWIREQARPTLQRAMVHERKDGSMVFSEARTNSDTRFTFPDTNLGVMLTAQAIARAVGGHFLDLEDTAVLHYTPGQEFKPHYDFLNPGRPGMKVPGQRFWTVLVYLNDDYEGGETTFPHLGFGVKGIKGNAVMFRNVDAKGEPDRMTLHAGAPTTRGEKWLLSQWVREPADWSGARPVRVKFTPGT